MSATGESIGKVFPGAFKVMALTKQELSQYSTQKQKDL